MSKRKSGFSRIKYLEQYTEENNIRGNGRKKVLQRQSKHNSKPENIQAKMGGIRNNDGGGY